MEHPKYRAAQYLYALCGQPYGLRDPFGLVSAYLFGESPLGTLWGACEEGDLETAASVCHFARLTADEVHCGNAQALRFALKAKRNETAQFLLDAYGWPDWAVFWAFVLACVKGEERDVRGMLRWSMDRLEAARVSDAMRQAALNQLIYHALCVAVAEGHIQVINWMAIDFRTSMPAFLNMLAAELDEAHDPQRRAQIETVFRGVWHAHQHQEKVA
jgi:hypothetical protein